jgi:virginiamycin A acetyltransferase
MRDLTKFKWGYVDESSQVHPTSVLYKNAEVLSCQLGEMVVVGDFSRLKQTRLEKLVKIDRYNLIQNSYVGRLSYTGAFSVIQSAKIGSFCSISWGVTIGGGEHNYSRITTHDFLYNSRYGLGGCLDSCYDRYSLNCEVGNDVWIGANATVLRGVVVGHGAVIGANSIVTHDVPCYAVVAGNPAKLIRYRFDEETIDRLLKLEWWHLDFERIKEKLSAFSSLDIDGAIEELEKQ